MFFDPFDPQAEPKSTHRPKSTQAKEHTGQRVVPNKCKGGLKLKLSKNPVLSRVKLSDTS